MSDVVFSHTFADIVAEFLVQEDAVPEGHTLRVNWREPEDPNQVILITDTDTADLQRFLSGEYHGSKGIQIRIRGNPDQQMAPRDVLAAIAAKLAEVRGATVDYDSHSYRVPGFHQTSDVLPMGKDHDRRWEWSCNWVSRLAQLS